MYNDDLFVAACPECGEKSSDKFVGPDGFEYCESCYNDNIENGYWAIDDNGKVVETE